MIFYIAFFFLKTWQSFLEKIFKKFHWPCCFGFYLFIFTKWQILATKKEKKRRGNEQDPNLTLQRVEPLQHVKDIDEMLWPKVFFYLPVPDFLVIWVKSIPKKNRRCMKRSVILFFWPMMVPATIRVSWLVSEWIVVAHCSLRILGEWRNHNGFQTKFVAYLFMHPTQLELLKSTEKCARYEHSKFLGVGARVQSKMKNLKTHEKNPTNMNRPLLSHTQWANNWQLSNTYPSSNTMSMQTEHFLLNKCSRLWVWFWFKLKLNRKSMDMNITMFVKL